MGKPEIGSLKTRLERGQSLVEMTIGFIVLSLIFAGMIDIGRLYFTYVALEDSAGEAALYLSLNPGKRGNQGDACTDLSDSGWCRARNATGGDIDWSSMTYNTKPVSTSALSTGETVQVTLTYNYQFITPMFNILSLDLSASAEQTVVSEQ